MDLDTIGKAPARGTSQGCDIDGIWVEFPFEPYDVQVGVMGWYLCRAYERGVSSDA